MAQPSTSSPSRPQPLALDSSLVQTQHALLDQGKHQQSKQQRQQQQQLQEEQKLLLHQQQQPSEQGKPLSLLSLSPTPVTYPPHSPHAAQRDSSNTSISQNQSHTHSIGVGAGHVSTGGDGDGIISITSTTAAATSANGGSTAHTHSDTHQTTTTTSSAGPPVHGRIENGQNGTRYNGDKPLSTSSLMSNPQPPPGPPRQPVNYPNPTSYPPAGMPSATQYAYPPQPVPPTDPYRPNPTQLPSMRTLDHVQSHQQLAQHQQQQQHPHQHHQHGIPLVSHMGAPMAPGPAMGYYNVAAHPYGIHPDPTGGMRFAIAPGLPPDPRLGLSGLSGGRHKKEIKRRTKTGCLTCRKRRIKCDETHPTCNNCKKSKRECLGYDPIFKQQGPAAIQPAPNSNNIQHQQQSATSQILASTPTVPSSATQHPPYQPPTVPSSYPTSLPSSVAFDSPVASTPQSAKTETGFEYSTAIDPALQGADTASSASGTPSPQYLKIKSEALDKSVGGQGQQLRGGTPSISIPPLLVPQPREIKLTYQSSPAKKMKVDELIALGGATPPIPSSPPSAAVVEEITKLYYEIYVPGLTLFFETQWYDLRKEQSQLPNSNSVSLLHTNKPVLNLFTSFLQNIIGIKSTDPADMAHSGHLETHVVWALARLPISSSPQDIPPRSMSAAPAEDDLLEARNRLYVFETLLSGDVLETNPLWSQGHTAPDSATGNGGTPLRKNEFGFWYHLAQFLLKSHSSMSVDDCSARERCLSQMRALLDGRENRDVLYSIAVLREYTLHWDATVNEQTVSSHLDESEPRSKLAVATRFVRNEASTEATTNVVRQFANLAYRAFVRPGFNSKSAGKKA